MSSEGFEFEVNGEVRLVAVPALRRLLDVLRDDLGLPGTKEGCGEGECGACTVMVDGQPVNSCIVPVCQVQGARVTTVEGAGLESVQDAYLSEGGTQCGICTPGLILMTRAWLDECEREGRTPNEQEARHALAGNLCRCTGYGKVIASALAAATAQGNADTSTDDEAAR